MALERWVFHNQNAGGREELSRALGIGGLLSAALAAKGVTSAEEGRRFLDADYRFFDPMLLDDMAEAVHRVREAIEDGEHIVVFGDFDADGITATALLVHYLESVGATVSSMLPHREKTGYGLSVESVHEIHARGANLIITVDNGVTAFEAIDEANQWGIDTIVIDHHQLGETLPNATAVIDPLRSDANSGVFQSLAGVGVTLLFVSAMEETDPEEMLACFADLVAIGTMADVVPLVAENRLIVRQGLELMRRGDHIGISALVRAAGLSPAALTADNISFAIAPRLNAAGRMGDAVEALALLLSEDESDADYFAGLLSDRNDQRRTAESELLLRLVRRIEEDENAFRQPMIVVAGEDVPTGIAGILAARLASRFGKPSIVLSVSDEEASGSGRSVGQFSLYEAIASCAALLTRFGGHDKAAGLALPADRIGAFKQAINAYAVANMSLSDYREREITLECEAFDFDIDEISELQRMEPYGAGNCQPLFATTKACIKGVYPLSVRHSRIRFEKNGTFLTAALFSVTPDTLPFSVGDSVDVAYTLSIFEKGSDRTISSRIEALLPAGLAKADFETIPLFDRALFGGVLSPAERKKIAPSRDEIGQVYRELRKAPVAFEKQEIVGRFFSLMPPGKALASVHVLTELSLIERNRDGKLVLSATAENGTKAELASSPLFSALHL